MDYENMTKREIEESLERKHQRKTRAVRIVDNGMTFRSAAAAAEYLGVTQTSVHNVLRKGQPRTAGVRLEYVEE